MRRTRVFPLATLVILLASLAHAQTAPPPQTLVLEKIPTGFVIAPDFKATEVDDQFAQLAGAYAARVTDDTLLIGGAGYSAATDALRSVLDGPTVSLGLQFGW